jgi:PIN domain nuclease of toxin-antitoxin system
VSDATLLLDSHVWVWTVAGQSGLGPKAIAAIRSSARNQSLAVSEVSFWELAVKASKGKLELMPDSREWLNRAAQVHGIGVVELNRQILVSGALLDWAHGDPADRMLVATALFYDLQLATADRVVLDYARTVRSLRVLDASK